MKNDSGILPLEYKVLVMVKKPPEKTDGGIVLPDDLREKEEMAETEGVLIDVGPDAFEDWGTSPKVGTHIIFAKYAGVYLEGNDEAKYRLINDKDILAIRSET